MLHNVYEHCHIRKFIHLPSYCSDYPNNNFTFYPIIKLRLINIIATINKKETDDLNFDALLADTPEIAKEVETLITEASKVLMLGSEKNIKLVDQAIVFSILRGFFSAPEINWNPSVKEWMGSASKLTSVRLLK